MRRLFSLWRCAAYCRRGVHRESVGWTFGIIQWQCVDCGKSRWIGKVVLFASNKITAHWSWEDEQ